MLQSWEPHTRYPEAVSHKAQSWQADVVKRSTEPGVKLCSTEMAVLTGRNPLVQHN